MVCDVVRLAININCRSESNLRMLRRSRLSSSSSYRKLLSRCFQVATRFQGWEPSNAHSIFLVRAPQFVEHLEVEPKLG